MITKTREDIMSLEHEIEFKVQVIIEPDGDGFHAYCPALKGLHIDGDTVEEVKQNATDAVHAYIDSLIKHNEPIPVGIRISSKRFRPRFPTFFRCSSRRQVIEDLVVTAP